MQSFAFKIFEETLWEGISVSYFRLNKYSSNKTMLCKFKLQLRSVVIFMVSFQIFLKYSSLEEMFPIASICSLVTTSIEDIIVSKLSHTCLLWKLSTLKTSLCFEEIMKADRQLKITVSMTSAHKNMEIFKLIILLCKLLTSCRLQQWFQINFYACMGGFLQASIQLMTSTALTDLNKFQCRVALLIFFGQILHK